MKAKVKNITSVLCFLYSIYACGLAHAQNAHCFSTIPYSSKYAVTNFKKWMSKNKNVGKMNELNASLQEGGFRMIGRGVWFLEGNGMIGEVDAFTGNLISADFRSPLTPKEKISSHFEGAVYWFKTVDQSISKKDLVLQNKPTEIDGELIFKDTYAYRIQRKAKFPHIEFGYVEVDSTGRLKRMNYLNQSVCVEIIEDTVCMLDTLGKKFFWRQGKCFDANTNQELKLDSSDVKFVLNSEEIESRLSVSVNPLGNLINGMIYVLRMKEQSVLLAHDYFPSFLITTKREGETIILEGQLPDKGKKGVLTMGSTAATVDGKPLTLSAAPQEIDGRLYLPYELLTLCNGVLTRYEPHTKTLYVDTRFLRRPDPVEVTAAGDDKKTAPVALPKPNPAQNNAPKTTPKAPAPKPAPKTGR